MSALLGTLAGFGVDLFPSGSDGPLVVGTASFASLFAVVAALGPLGGRILVAFTGSFAYRSAPADRGLALLEPE